MVRHILTVIKLVACDWDDKTTAKVPITLHKDIQQLRTCVANYVQPFMTALHKWHIIYY